jgi:arginyl-tRNA synthetase
MPEEQAKEIARIISIGAIIWNDLKTDRVSSVRFDIDRMLELGGDSVIDVLYTYSRTCSILSKLNISDESPLDGEYSKTFSNEFEHNLAVRLSELGDTIQKAVEARAPHILVSYLSELSQLHGRFYEESRVIGVDDQLVANLRIALHRAYKVVIRNGLELLNIPLTERL